MSKVLHNKLATFGRKAGLSGRDLNAYIYSTLERIKKRRKEKRRRGSSLARPKKHT